MWSLNEPNNEEGNENCAVFLYMNGIAGLSDIPCSYAYRFICEVLRTFFKKNYLHLLYGFFITLSGTGLELARADKIRNDSVLKYLDGS